MRRRNIIDVSVLDDFILECEFDDGSVRYYNMEHRLKPVGLVKDLMDPEYFAKVFVNSDGDLEWPNGADIGAFTIYHDGSATLPSKVASSLLKIMELPTREEMVAALTKVISQDMGLEVKS